MALSKKDHHVGKFFQEAKIRARQKSVPFTITLKYLRGAANDYCPVFKHKFLWGRSGLGRGKTTGNSPSLDRIIPELGYIPGNVIFISHNANRIKSNATEKQIYAVADWLHEARKEVLKNVATQQFASIPTRLDIEVKGDPESGVVFTTRLRQDGNDAHHHSGTVYGQDIDSGTKKSS